MKKKMLSVLLAMTMICGTLAGCGSTEENKEESKSNAPASEEKKDAEESKEEVKELTTIKILCNNDFSETVKTEDWEQYPVSQEVIKDLEEIGIKLELECVPGGELNNIVETRLASGVDLPDIISIAFGGEDAPVEWGKNGIICDVAELVEQYDEDGSIIKFYNDMAPGVWESKMTPEGNRYWFSYFVSTVEKIDKETGDRILMPNAYSLNLRYDWLQKIGEELKPFYTPEEMRDVWKKMRDMDANGNGAADEVVEIDITSFWNVIAQAYGMHDGLLYGYCGNMSNEPVYIGSDPTAEITCNFYHENFDEYIKFMQTLVEEGVYSTEFLGQDRGTMVAQDRASAAWQSCIWDWESNMLEADPETVYYVPTLIDMDGNLENGHIVKAGNIGPSVYSTFMIPEACENKEAVIRLFDYVYTEKYALMSQFGLEGIAWDWDENGNVLRKYPESDPAPEAKQLYATSLAIYALPRLHCYPTVFERTTEGMTASMKAKNEWLWDYHLDSKYSKNAILTQDALYALPSAEEAEIISKSQSVLTTYAQELLTGLILGEKSLDDMPTYLKEMEDLGLKEYVAVWQARYDRAHK